MIKFFRRLRKKIIGEGDIKKYLFYAVGEILLIVIGILFALQLNTWNSNRLHRDKINNYYSRIYHEIEFELYKLKPGLEAIDKFISDNNKSLNILKSSNKDSITTLGETLGALSISYTVEVSLPVTKEFIRQIDENIIENDSILHYLRYINSNLEALNSLDDAMDTQYFTAIQPFFVENINYATVTKGFHKQHFVQGGPENNYQSLSNSLELWNLLTFKVEMLIFQKHYLKWFIYSLEKLNEEIAKELED